MVVFYEIWKSAMKYNYRLKNKKDLNNLKMKTHPPSPVQNLVNANYNNC